MQSEDDKEEKNKINEANKIINFLFEEVRKFEHGLGSIDKIVNAANIFEDLLKDKANCIRVRKKCSTLLCFLYEKLKKIDDMRICSFKDRILLTKMSAAVKKQTSNVSYIFEEFIKGITYFKYEQEPVQPIYHRFSSCGPKTNNMSNVSLKDQKRNSETCYIERLIYDQLYTHLSFHFSTSGEPSSQDSQHLDRLEKTKEEYQKLHKGLDLEVYVGFHENLPVNVTITKSKLGRKVVTDSYIKHFFNVSLSEPVKYDPIVDCYKTLDNNIQFVKFQSFYRESPRWTKKTTKATTHTSGVSFHTIETTLKHNTM